MANKRMFSLSVVDTDKFLEMPISCRLLYYELGMRADDDGFVDNWKKILLFTGLKEDDLKVLIAKQFIIPFESGVIVIRHWRMNNYLQNDRTKPTIYQDELKQLDFDNGEYNLINFDYIEQHNNFSELDNKDKRKQAYENSELPYSFDYKIKKAFANKNCPICGYEMKNYVNAPHRPTIQHNIPISKGGKHELGNISVICHKCNVSIRDTETDTLNSQEVIEEWDKINSCIQPCIHRIEENSIEENSINNICVSDFEKEFETLWKLYPKKVGKKDALRHYIRNRKKKVPYETILEGLNKYIEYINKSNVATQYIKDGSSWFNQESWNDERKIENKEQNNVPYWMKDDFKFEESELSGEERLNREIEMLERT